MQGDVQHPGGHSAEDRHRPGQQVPLPDDRPACHRHAQEAAHDRSDAQGTRRDSVQTDKHGGGDSQELNICLHYILKIICFVFNILCKSEFTCLSYLAMILCSIFLDVKDWLIK